MKKFYLVYFIAAAILYACYLLAEISAPTLIYGLWTGAVQSGNVPMIIPYIIPGIITLVSALVAWAVARPPLQFRRKDLLVDLPIVIIPAFLAWTASRYLSEYPIRADFALAYNTLFIFGGSLAGIIIVLFRHIITTKEPEDESADPADPKRKPATFTGAFFSVWAIVSVLPLLLALAMPSRMWDTQWGPEREEAIFFWILYLILVISGTAGYYFTEKLYKRSVFAGFLVFAVAFCIFAGTSVIAVQSTWDCSESNDLFSYDKYAWEVESDPDEVYGDYSEDDYYQDGDGYYEEGYDDGDGMDSFIGLVGEDDDDHDMVIRALTFARDFMDLSEFPYQFHYDLKGYKYPSADVMDDEYGSHDYYHITRYLFQNSSMISITEIMENYIITLRDVITPAVYRDNGYGMLVDLLLESYQDLYDDGDGWPEKFRQVFDIMNRDIPEHEWYKPDGEQYPLFEVYFNMLRRTPLISYDVVENYTDDDVTYHELLVWAYSFWGRRYNENEGNPYDIFRALNLLRQHM